MTSLQTKATLGRIKNSALSTKIPLLIQSQQQLAQIAPAMAATGANPLMKAAPSPKHFQGSKKKVKLTGSKINILAKQPQ